MRTDYAELRALAEKATPGPWWEDRRKHPSAVFSPSCREACGIAMAFTTERGQRSGEGVTETSRHDVRFIAAANPAAIMDLLDELERLQALLYEYEIEAL